MSYVRRSLDLVRRSFRGTSKLTRQIPSLPNGCITTVRSISFIDTVLQTAAQDITRLGIIGAIGAVSFPLAKMYHNKHDITKAVTKRFVHPTPPTLIREGDHFSRKEDEKKVKKAFFEQNDSLGLVGVVFGPAGTGKSNVVRTICYEDDPKDPKNPKGREGVIYMEVGSPRQFPYHLANACGIPVEPSWLDAVVSKLFTSFRTYVTLPSDDCNALALVLPIIAEGAKEYKDGHSQSTPVLFIDGVDILAKETDNKLYRDLVDWAKKCTNENSLRIVLVCSDSHVLALDQQSFKSRLDGLVEIDDVTKDQAVDKLMVGKYHFTNVLAESAYEIVGGRLADIHKFVSEWRRVESDVIPQEVVDATSGTELQEINGMELQKAIHTVLEKGVLDKNPKNGNLEMMKDDRKELVLDYIRSYKFTKAEGVKKFEQQFEREMQQAYCKAMSNGSGSIKKYIIEQVLKNEKTVEDIAFENHGTEIGEVTAAIQDLLRHNVLRINAQRKLLCYNNVMNKCLKQRIEKND